VVVFAGREGFSQSDGKVGDAVDFCKSFHEHLKVIFWFYLCAAKEGLAKENISWWHLI